MVYTKVLQRCKVQGLAHDLWSEYDLIAQHYIKCLLPGGPGGLNSSNLDFRSPRLGLISSTEKEEKKHNT